MAHASDEVGTHPGDTDLDPRLDPEQAGGFRSTVEIVATGLGALMAALSQTLVIPVLPEIATDMRASATATQWMLTATLLTGAVAVPILSRLADMYGRRLLLMISLAALTVGSLMAALTSNVEVMIAGRALSGLASASIPLGISLLAATLPASRKGSAVALISAMLGIGSALGLPLAGLIADNFSYRVLFWIGAIGALISVVLVRLLVPEPKPSREGSVDVLGALLLAGGLVSLILPLSQGTDWGWTSLRTLGLLVLSVVLLFLLTLTELRTTNPLVNVRAMANPPVAITNVASIFIGFALFATFVGTANYVQAPEATGYGFDSSVLTAGLCLMPGGVLMLLLSPVTARLIGSWGAGRVLALGGTIIALGLLVRITLVADLWQIVVGSTVIGLGSGIGYAALPSLINHHTPAHDLAAANGINTLARSLGSTLASALGGSLLAAITMSLGPGIEVPSLTGYRVLFTICAVAALLAAGAGLVVHRTGEAKTAAAADES
ncbi:MFS transporter [Kineosporia sp. J2-2]|uniref:MFS transporter n=1 Tax=Kineosporia corallincola TaxID=2835133 RepID=A0ABS5TH83_9ACTN|nr:MFS transporter [Kineosporia corallincola]MBT0769408.1 MFS transporter [Kineosporia corallincola]